MTISLKILKAISQNFTKRKHHDSVSDKQYRQIKKIVNGNKLHLRKYGEVRFQTSPEYFELLNNPNTKFNNITITYDGIDFYAIINIDYYAEEWELTGKSVGCDINSNRNGWLVTSDGEKNVFRC